MASASELSINTGASAIAMAQKNFGDSVTIVSASYNGDTLSSGIFADGDATSPGVVPKDFGVILSTGHAENVTNDDYNTEMDGFTRAMTFTMNVNPGVVANDSVVLTTGQTVTRNADKTLNFPCDGDIETDKGAPAVERLQPGDMIWTLDNGYQPLRWIGQSTGFASGAFTPVRVTEATFGDHGTLLVSPQHRILVHDPLAVLVFSTAEVLIAAKHLVDDRNVTIVEGGMNGIATLFLDFDRGAGDGHCEAAQQILKQHEARLLGTAA